MKVKRFFVFSIGLLAFFAASVCFGQTVKSFTNIEDMSGWGKCTVCAGSGGSGASGTSSITYRQNPPSLDGTATRFNLSGSSPYTDGLFWKELIYPTNSSVNKATHHFIYDAYFYIKDATAAQSLEWDINQYVGGHKYLWGTQCSYRGAGTWDIYDNIGHKWVSTGIACHTPTAYVWHHVVIEVERTTSNQLHYISLAMDGNTHYINKYYSPTSTSYDSVTINYQMDGNKSMTPYATWVDKLTLKYW
jgi:hypothetical protein